MTWNGIRRLLALGTVCAAATALTAGTAQAGTSTTHPDSTTFHNATASFGTFVPCHPELGGYLVTLTYNGQMHSTANANGFWATGTETGTFTAVPIEVQLDTNGNPVVDPDGNLIPLLDEAGNPIPRSGETFTGHFTDWFGASINRNESVATDTSTIQGAGSAGTTFASHDNSHIVTDGPGDPFDPTTPLKIAFDHATCG